MLWPTELLPRGRAIIAARAKEAIGGVVNLRECLPITIHYSLITSPMGREGLEPPTSAM